MQIKKHCFKEDCPKKHHMTLDDYFVQRKGTEDPPATDTHKPINNQ